MGWKRGDEERRGGRWGEERKCGMEKERDGGFFRYPEKCSTCPWCPRKLHRRPKTAVQHILARARNFGHGYECILRDPAAHPELQSRIAA